MDHGIFIQLSLILAVAAVVSIIFRYLKQPLIIGYILTGFIVGPSLLNIIHDHEAFASFSQIGIALLLFIIGLGLSVGTIKATGKPVLAAFLGIIIGVGGLSFAAAKLFGFNLTDSLIFAIAPLFSSTIIVIKALSDKKEHNRLYGQIAIGILIADDIAAMLALIVISGLGGQAGGALGADGLLSSHVVSLVIKGLILSVALILCGAYILPRAMRVIARNQEILYVCALAWALGVASIFYWYGFSMEVGALFAGVAMAHLPYAQQISTRLKPLRDFFIVLFFVELGQSLGGANLGSAVVPAVVLSLIVMLFKPLSILAGMGILGFTKQTGFKASLHLSQISEFSIVFVVLAVNTGIASKELTAIVTLTAIITIVFSAYLMKYDDELYARFEKILSVFERTKTRREIRTLKTYPLILLGYRNGGHEFIKTFRSMHRKYVVIDYDPEVIEHLESQHINHLYGDVTDLELLEEISLHDAELVVSTIPDVAINTMLARHIMGHEQRGEDKATIFVCHAATLDEAVRLYKNGASYVLLPHLIGSEKASNFILRYGNDRRAFERYRERHMKHLVKSTDKVGLRD